MVNIAIAFVGPKQTAESKLLAVSLNCLKFGSACGFPLWPILSPNIV